MRATFHNMKEKMDQELKAIDELYAEYTPERRVNISRQLREQKMGDATKQEKELAEQKYQDEWARQVKKAKYQHQVFLEQEVLFEIFVPLSNLLMFTGADDEVHDVFGLRGAPSGSRGRHAGKYWRAAGVQGPRRQ